jgi:hypothetical protein
MPLTSVPAIYDGERIQLLEDAPVDGPYRVLVTFVGPVEDPQSELDTLIASFGAWQDDRPIASTLADIYDARRSRRDPPNL